MRRSGLLLLFGFGLAAQQTEIQQTPAMLGVRYEQGNWLDNFTARYKQPTIDPVNLANSPRLDTLMRGGRIYLSMQDAIALALENNLDIEIQRYGPKLAQAELMRARAGGLLRGIPTQLERGSTAASSAVTGGAGSTIGSSSAGGFSGAGGGGTTAQAGGFVFSTSGSAIPTLDPIAFTSYTYGHRTNINANSFSTGIPATVISNHSPNIGIQKAWLTGTQATFQWNNSHVQTNVPRAEINPFYTSNFSLQISQRLLQGFGVAVNNRNIRIARNEVKVADLVFEQQVIQTVASVVNLYWDLVSINEDVRVKKQALALAEKLLSDNRKQVEIGTLAPIEIVRAEAEVARTQQDLTISETQLLQQETLIKNALSRVGIASPAVAEARLAPTDSIRIPEQEAVRPFQDLVQMALDSRPDLKQTHISIESTKIGLQGSRSALRPSLDVVATMQNNGLAGSVNTLPIPGLPPGVIAPPTQANPTFLGGYGSALGQLFRRNYPDYSLGFQLNIPLVNRQAQADMINDQLRLRQQELRQQQQLNQIRVDIQNALIGLQQARARHQAAVKARVFAEQTLDAEQKKYALGASTIFLVIQAQRDLAQAQGSEVAALSAYSRARNQFDFSTGQTLSVNNVIIEEAKKGQVSRASVPIGAR